MSEKIKFVRTEALLEDRIKSLRNKVILHTDAYKTVSVKTGVAFEMPDGTIDARRSGKGMVEDFDMMVGELRAGYNFFKTALNKNPLSTVHAKSVVSALELFHQRLDDFDEQLDAIAKKIAPIIAQANSSARSH